MLEPDIETLNIQLEKFGHQLYKAGRPYNHYVDSQCSDRSPTKDSKVNATSLGSCLCLVTLWASFASALAGAFVSACYSFDLGLAIGCRYSRSLMRRIYKDWRSTVSFAKSFSLAPPQRLWPFSGQTMRSKLQKLLEANKLTHLPPPYTRGLDLGCLRAGGASWLLMRSEDSTLTRRRGRWISNKIMEIYVQEVCALSFKSTSSHKEFIVSGVQIFPCMKRVDELQRAKVPEMVWSTLLKDDAVATELDEWRLNGTGG